MSESAHTWQPAPLLLALFISLLPSCRSNNFAHDIESRRDRLFRADRSASAVVEAERSLRTDLDRSAEPPTLQSMRLADCVAHGLRSNAGLQAAFETWVAAIEKIPQVTALPDPRFSFGQFVESVETRTGPQEQTFGLSQTFPWFGKLEARGLVQAREADRLWSLVLARRLEVEREIRDAWWEFAYLAESLRISKNNLALLERLEPVVQRKIQGGSGEDELLRLQVEIGKLENEIESLRESRRPVSARLRAAMNWRGGEVLDWPEIESASPLAVDRVALREQLRRANPELLSLQDAAARSQAAVESAELEGWPDVTLGVNYIATDAARAAGVSGSGDDPLLFTLSFNIPVQRGRYDAAIRQARAEKASALAALQQRENDLLSHLALRVYELEDARRQIELYENSLLPRARQALEVTEVSYRAGKADLGDLIDSQRVLLAFEKSLDRARADHEQAVAAVEALCGGRIR